MSAKGLFVLSAVVALGLSGTACSRQDNSLYAETSTVAASPPTLARSYVGRWAVTAENCATHPWIFSATRLSAGDGAVCDIQEANSSTAGYSLPGVCRRPSGDLPGRLLLTFAGTDSMTLTGGPYQNPVTLVRCPAQGQGAGLAGRRLTGAG